VEAFLDRKLGFMGIPRVIDKALSAHQPENLSTLEVVRRVDQWARQYARDAIRELSSFS
jgi:1-deoxy-D-xylulose-5-phosphate reductoisomerase